MARKLPGLRRELDARSLFSVAYGEIVATVSSRSVGPGTRKNIDEFTRTTAAAVERVGGAKKGKAVIIVNPAEPPLIMRDTVHCLTEDEPDHEAITASIHQMIAEVRKYVPGYTLVNGPVFEGRRVSAITVQNCGGPSRSRTAYRSIFPRAMAPIASGH